MAGYARSVLGLLDALGVGPAAFAGHSMGGGIALTLALEAPARVAALALVGTGARLRVGPAILQATSDPESYRAFGEASAERSFGPGASPALRAAFAEGWRAVEASVTHGDFLACDAFDVTARLPEIRAPAAVICGSCDALTPPKYSEYLRDHIAGARLTRVAGAGHMVMLEAPGAVAEAIQGLLATLA
jgi:pimeloyl-ACP methyl ester carboxylesterase